VTTALAGSTRPRRHHRAPLPLLGAGLVAAGVAVVPMAYLVARVGERGWGRAGEILTRPSTLRLTLRSLELAASVTAACVVIGVALAWLVTSSDLPGRRVWRVALALPLALPSYVAGWAWIGWRPELAGRTGAFAVLTLISYPYVYLPALAAFRRCDPALADVSRTAGNGAQITFLRATLPQIRVAVIGGALLVGLYVLSDFGAVAAMRYQVLTHAIFRAYRASFDRTTAAVLGALLAVLAIVVVAIVARVDRRALGHLAARPPRAQPITPLGRARWPALLAPLTVLGLALGVPAIGLVSWSRRGVWTPDWSVLGTAALHTLWVGALGALVVVALGLPVAFLVVRHPGSVSHLAVGSAYAGHALPGVVVGLAMVFFGVRAVPGVYQRLPLLVLAYAVLYLSLGLGALTNAVGSVPRALEHVSRSLGRGPAATWWAVTVRLVLPGVGAAATLVFLTIMKELPATLFLRPTGFDTLATRLWDEASSLSRAQAVPYAVAIVIVAALPAALLSIVGERRAASRRVS
jgi:iron(III) transport system permease protein